MDIKQMGLFIAQRRKELKLTQSALAEKIHVTDKAVSRWERGVGMPDISNLEILAEALDVSLIELMQAKRNETDQISTQEAEKVIVDTIQLSKENSVKDFIGRSILFLFGLIATMLVIIIVKHGSIVFYTAAGIIAGLASWAVPVWKLTIKKDGKNRNSVLISFGFYAIALICAFLEILSEVNAGDFAALLDITDNLVTFVVIYSVITYVLNWMIKEK